MSTTETALKLLILDVGVSASLEKSTKCLITEVKGKVIRHIGSDKALSDVMLKEMSSFEFAMNVNYGLPIDTDSKTDVENADPCASLGMETSAFRLVHRELALVINSSQCNKVTLNLRHVSSLPDFIAACRFMAALDPTKINLVNLNVSFGQDLTLDKVNQALLKEENRCTLYSSWPVFLRLSPLECSGGKQFVIHYVDTYNVSNTKKLKKLFNATVYTDEGRKAIIKMRHRSLVQHKNVHPTYSASFGIDPHYDTSIFYSTGTLLFLNRLCITLVTMTGIVIPIVSKTWDENLFSEFNPEAFFVTGAVVYAAASLLSVYVGTKKKEMAHYVMALSAFTIFGGAIWAMNQANILDADGFHLDTLDEKVFTSLYGVLGLSAGFLGLTSLGLAERERSGRWGITWTKN